MRTVLYTMSVTLGGGTPSFPTRDQRLTLELVETKTFASTVLYQRYRRNRGPDAASAEGDGVQ